MSIEVVPLREVATITAGQSPPGSTYNENGLGLPFFQGKADFGGVRPIARKWCVAPRKIAEAGDILISVRAPVGPTNIAGELCCIGRGLAAVRPDETVALRDFVHWMIKHREPELIAKGQGSTFAVIGQKDLKSLLIPLLPIDEQRWIVGILNRAAKIAHLRRQATERLRELVPALFIKVFGDPVENPMGWNVERLSHVIVRGPQNGLYKPKSEYGSGTLILLIDGFYDGHVTDPATWQRVRLDEFTAKQYTLSEGDIVVNRVNSQPFLGKSAIIPDIMEPAVFESNMMRIKLDLSRILPQFLISLLQIASIKQRLVMNAKDAINQSSINQTDVRQLQVIVPPLALQRRYTEIVETARMVARGCESSARTGAALMTSLMSELLWNDASEHRGADEATAEPAVGHP